MARASNTLSVSEYEKILLGNKTSVLRTDLGKSLEDFCAIHQKLVVDLLEKTPRISKTMLHAALMTLEGQDASDAKSFAGKVVEVVSAARAMSKSFASGKKTTPAMAAVVKVVLQWSRSSLPVQRTPSRSPRESAATTPVSDPQVVPKKRLFGKTSPVHARALFQEVPDSPVQLPVRKLSKAEVMVQLGLPASSSVPEPGLAEVQSISSSSDGRASPPALGSSNGLAPGSRGTSKTYWVNSKVPCLVKSIDGTTQEATMKAGPHGFGIAVFHSPSEEKETEIPNLNLLKPVVAEAMKRPAAKKRPASSMEPAVEPVVSDGSDTEEKLELPEQVEMNYTIMKYKTGAVAIRESKLGKRQLFQILNRGKSTKQLVAILEAAREKLLSGQAVQQVKQWAQAEAAK